MAPISINGSTGISGVDGSAAAPALQGSDTNTGIAFGSDVIIGSTGGTERFRCDSGGRMLVGTSSSLASCQLEINAAAQSIHARSNNDAADFSRYQAGVNGSFIFLRKSRNATLGSHTIVNNGDALGGIEISGSDGTNFIAAARIAAEVDGAPGANDMPGRLVFSTTADGASSPTERMRIDSNGVIFFYNLYARTTANAANVYVGSGGDLNRSTSSIKYKTDVETLQDSYADAVLNCRPVWYRSTASVDNPDWGWWGFIAEEVAEIDPRLVHWKTSEPVVQENGRVDYIACEPEPEGVAYERFVPHLLNLIKRQQQAIETLEAKVAALESA